MSRTETGARKVKGVSHLYMFTRVANEISLYTSYTEGRTLLAFLPSLRQTNSVFWAFISKNVTLAGMGCPSVCWYKG